VAEDPGPVSGESKPARSSASRSKTPQASAASKINNEIPRYRLTPTLLRWFGSDILLRILEWLWLLPCRVRLRYFVGQTAKLHRDVVNNPGRICRPNRRHIYADLESKPTVHDLGVDI
jgi:hypothetical protein